MKELQRLEASDNKISLDVIHKLLSESNIQRVLETLTKYVEVRYPQIRALIMIYDEQSKGLTYGCYSRFPEWNLDPNFVMEVKPNYTASSEAAYYKKSILISNALKEQNLSPQYREYAQKVGIGAVLSIPILSSKSDLLGVFSFFYPEEVLGQPKETPFFEALTSLASVTLERLAAEHHNKKLLEQLQISEERLRLALRAQKMGVWDWYIPENRLIWDDTMLEIFGVHRDELQGNFWDFESHCLPEDVENILSEVQSTLQEKTIFDYNFRIIRHGEIRYLAAAGYIVRDDNGRPLRMTGLNWDVTDKVIAQKKIDQERAKAIANAKMASLGEMASGVAHEINNPLTIILNRANQLKSRLENDKFEKEWAIGELGKIETTVERIAKIIRGLRSISRNAETDPLISCDFSSILEDTLELCREKFKRFGITLTIRGMQNAFVLKCRPSQISQVLLNLFNNSFDAVVNTQNPWIELEVYTHQNNLVLRVTDSGHGIPAQVVERMMDPFFSTKEVGRGTGLGLSISKGIIEEHHGRLWYDREHPFTSFVIELPFEEVQRPIRSSDISVDNLNSQ